MNLSFLKSLRVFGAKSPPLSAEQDFSQFGEQKIILDFFSGKVGKYVPHCVDAGAFDGVVGSNSRALFMNGWSGVAIEPNPRTYARLVELYRERADIKCVQVALSDHSSKAIPMQFSIGPAGVPEEDKWMYAQVSTLNEYFADNYRQKHSYVYEAADVELTTLEEILVAQGTPRNFGFLSIDCEGEDVRIVRAFDFRRFSPLLVCVETNDANRPLFAEPLVAAGYRHLAHTVSNTFFVRT